MEYFNLRISKVFRQYFKLYTFNGILSGSIYRRQLPLHDFNVVTLKTIDLGELHDSNVVNLEKLKNHGFHGDPLSIWDVSCRPMNMWPLVTVIVLKGCKTVNEQNFFLCCDEIVKVSTQKDTFTFGIFGFKVAIGKKT